MRRSVTPFARALGVLIAALVAVVTTAVPSHAAAKLTIDAQGTMTDGQKVSITGSGFDPNLKAIAIGQCREGYAGPGDCNLQGGAFFRDADGSGNVATLTITVKEKFGDVDCLKEKCVIAAGPLPQAVDEAAYKRNTFEMPMSFQAEAAPPAEAPAQAPATTAPTTAAPTTTTALPKTGAGDSVPVLLLGATALVAAGAGVMLLVPGRRRAEAQR